MAEDKITATVFRESGFVMAGIHRLILAVTDGADTLRINASFAQSLTQRQGTAFTEGAVVFFRAAFIAVAFNQQFHVGVSRQSRRHGSDVGLFAVLHDGTVKFEMNRVSREG